jgi:transcriptional regulator GlxA family with amidase domain
MGTPASQSVSARSADEAAFERHFSVEELAELWGMSQDFVRRLFIHEPGVVIFFKYRPGRRTYRTLRIPESVARRVHQEKRRG